MQFATHAFCNTCILQHVHFITCAFYNTYNFACITCNFATCAILQHIQFCNTCNFATHAIYNMCSLQYVQRSTCIMRYARIPPLYGSEGYIWPKNRIIAVICEHLSSIMSGGGLARIRSLRL